MPEPGAASPPPLGEKAGVIEVELASGGRMRITEAVETRTVAACMLPFRLILRA
jgi:hypothetical protein